MATIRVPVTPEVKDKARERRHAKEASESARVGNDVWKAIETYGGREVALAALQAMVSNYQATDLDFTADIAGDASDRATNREADWLSWLARTSGMSGCSTTGTPVTEPACDCRWCQLTVTRKPERLKINRAKRSTFIVKTMEDK